MLKLVYKYYNNFISVCIFVSHELQKLSVRVIYKYIIWITFF